MVIETCFARAFRFLNTLHKQASLTELNKKTLLTQGFL
jgi:hypothetical protein